MATNVTALRTILVATDGSADAALAARIAADLARRTGAALHLIHTWQPVPVTSYPYPSVQLASTYQLYQSDAEAVLADAAGELTAGGVRPAATHLHCGQPVGAIVTLAEELRVDLIVLGSRGLGTLRRLVLGSVSEGVAHEARRPVLIVRGGDAAWPPQRVVVGDDGSSAAQQPIELASLIARQYDASLRLVHASPAPHGALRDGEEIFRRTVGLGPVQDERVGVIRDEVFHRISGMLNERIVALQAAGPLDAAPEVIFDDPAAAIVGAAEGTAASTLIVVGSRGLGALARLRLGSVSTKILHAAAGPVLVVPQRRT